jgi:hypothetical protein
VSCLLRLAPTACLLAVAETAPLQPSSCIVMAPPVSQHVRPRLRRLRARRALRDARPGATPGCFVRFLPQAVPARVRGLPVSCCHCVLSSGIVAQRICSPRTTKTSCCVFATPGPGQPPARPAPSCPARGARHPMRLRTRAPGAFAVRDRPPVALSVSSPPGCSCPPSPLHSPAKRKVYYS